MAPLCQQDEKVSTASLIGILSTHTTCLFDLYLYTFFLVVAFTFADDWCATGSIFFPCAEDQEEAEILFD